MTKDKDEMAQETQGWRMEGDGENRIERVSQGTDLFLPFAYE